MKRLEGAALIETVEAGADWEIHYSNPDEREQLRQWVYKQGRMASMRLATRASGSHGTLVVWWDRR